MLELNEASLQLWSAFVSDVHVVIRHGLADMATGCEEHGFAAMNEHELNRQLFHRLNRAAARRKKQSLGQNLPPVISPNLLWDLIVWAEASNQPSPDDPERVSRENKRPDFQWGFLDPDDANGRRTYVVECKRIGSPVRSNWVFNTNYVTNGIKRFLLEEYLYGKDEVGGGMVGYMQSMDIATIRQQINAQLAIETLPELSLPQPDPEFGNLRAAEQILSRQRAKAPFRLSHFWVDLRRPTSESGHANPIESGTAEAT